MNVLDRLLAAGPVVVDGAWGTQLQARGLTIGENPDGWNLSHPEQVEEVARAYVEAGSRVILTNTFRANRIALAPEGLADRTAEINRAGVALSRRAAAGRARVFASLGPCGKLLLSGEVTEHMVATAFGEQARALAEAGADAVVVETMADVAEARLAIEAVKDAGLPVIACMVFDSGRNRDRTMMGINPEQAVAALEQAGADAVGANCGRGIEAYVAICRRLRAATKLPVWIKANAGMPELIEGRPVYRTTPDEFAGFGPALVSAGADFIGGCCGTGPEHIRALLRKLGCQALPGE